MEIIGGGIEKESNTFAVFNDSFELKKLVTNLIKSTNTEIIGTFYTSRAFHRQEKEGTITLIGMLRNVTSRHG